MRSVMMTRSPALVTKCCSSKNLKETPVTVARKRFEAKRGVSLKENLNKLLVIATADIKEYGDFVKELDDIHRKEVKELFNKAKSSVVGDSAESVAEEEGENIFVDRE